MSFRDTLFVRFWSLWNVPALHYTKPTVVEANDQRCVVRIRLRRRTRNHLGSMYFGVLCIGVDCAGGLIAMRCIRKSGKKISLIFKDVHGEFLKRAEGDVDFTCEDGEAIAGLVERVSVSGERESLPVTVVATVPAEGPEPVARFVLTLSLKQK